ncbi:hypothetical protein DRP44_03120 [candidate division TA06 bacterium]|uniref:Uncharacterized protein n=1 Tax=candidate division TA06 bacterium TaxID=2250710 RepID=A0A660SBB4_UNCT6|nr:MAG: hypothetical protein DRP44_03120 [candidate division TA06 bacterium]
MIKIAYCPTMKQYAETISKNINEVDMLEGSAAAAVLAAFRENQVDGVLIGRRAKRYEIDERTKFRKLKSGLTLVYLQKAAIDEAQLSSIPVKTYLKKERLLQVEHLFKSVEYRSSFEACFEDGLEIPAIIDWDDYKDEFELLIPMNRYGKTPIFRAPVLYYKDIGENIVESIGNLLKK